MSRVLDEWHHNIFDIATIGFCFTYMKFKDLQHHQNLFFPYYIFSFQGIRLI